MRRGAVRRRATVRRSATAYDDDYLEARDRPIDWPAGDGVARRSKNPPGITLGKSNTVNRIYDLKKLLNETRFSCME